MNMTSLIFSFKGRMAKDENYHKFIHPYIVTCITSGEKPFAFNKMKEAIIKRLPYIETINIKLDNSHNITYNVRFHKPKYYKKIEEVDLCIRLECEKEIYKKIKKDENFAKKFKKMVIK